VSVGDFRPLKFERKEEEGKRILLASYFTKFDQSCVQSPGPEDAGQNYYHFVTLLTDSDENAFSHPEKSCDFLCHIIHSTIFLFFGCDAKSTQLL
jgi:hypothetical protein